MDVVFYTRHTSPEPLTPRVLLARNVSRWFGYGGIIFVMLSKKLLQKLQPYLSLFYTMKQPYYHFERVWKKTPDLNIQHIQ